MNNIYLWCEPLGTGLGIVNVATVGGDVIGYAEAEDGELLTNHISSNEEYSKYDLGLDSKRKHEIYEKKYPNGYRLIWIGKLKRADFRKQGEMR